MHTLTGGCHCGNITIAMELRRLPKAYQPRACDCEFCRKHGAAYVADPEGDLRFKIKDMQRIVRYRQGSGQADFLLCGGCGVLVGVVYQDGDQLRGVVNVHAMDAHADWDAEQPASPKLLSAEEKAARWRTLWFARVSLVHGDDL